MHFCVLFVPCFGPYSLLSSQNNKNSFLITKRQPQKLNPKSTFDKLLQLLVANFILTYTVSGNGPMPLSPGFFSRTPL